MSIGAKEKYKEGEVAVVFAQILVEFCIKLRKIILRNDHS